MADDKPLRLFVAVAAPEAVKGAAASAVRRLQGTADVRWTPPENLHLTLKFLGDTPPGLAPALHESLRNSANAFSRFVVELAGFGVLPNSRTRRTVCVWVGQEAGPLGELAERVDAAVNPLGYAREKRSYRGHLTIGRVRTPRGIEKLREAGQRWWKQAEPVDWPIDEILLVQSELRPGGAVYTTLGSFPLKEEQSPRPGVSTS